MSYNLQGVRNRNLRGTKRLGVGKGYLPRDCHGFDPNAILDGGQMQPRLAFKCERVGGETLKVAFRRCRGAAELPEMSLL